MIQLMSHDDDVMPEAMAIAAVAATSSSRATSNVRSAAGVRECDPRLVDLFLIRAPFKLSWRDHLWRCPCRECVRACVSVREIDLGKWRFGRGCNSFRRCHLQFVVHFPSVVATPYFCYMSVVIFNIPHNPFYMNFMNNYWKSQLYVFLSAHSTLGNHRFFIFLAKLKV